MVRALNQLPHYKLLAWLQVNSATSHHHNKNNESPNQWIIRCKITLRLLKIHLALLKNSWLRLAA